MMDGKTRRSVLVFVVFLLYFTLGLFIYRDYGISWDEEINREYGHLVYEFVLGKNATLPVESFRFLGGVDIKDFLMGKPVRFRMPPNNTNLRFYGPVYDTLLAAGEQLMRLDNTRDVYLFRHLVSSLLFFIATIFFYKLLYLRYKDWKLPLVGVLFLMLSPRMFAERFYNPIDIPALSLFIIAVYTCVRFLQSRSTVTMIIHAVVSAILVDIRIAGILIVVCTVVFTIQDLFSRSSRRLSTMMLARLIAYLTLWFGCTVLLFPTLWFDPIGNFLTAIGEMGHFSWPGTMFFMGRFVRPDALPWYYIPVWIGITTPVAYTLLGIIGTFSILSSVCRKSLHWKSHRIDLLFLLWFFIPIVIVIFFHSVVYDGWRHLYFVYPALLAIAIHGLGAILRWIHGQNTRVQRLLFVILFVAIGVNIGRVISFMVRYHPYQNVYFNQLAGGMTNAKKNFELDYWGLTYRKGLEYIARNAPHPPVTVVLATYSNVFDILSPEDKKNLIQVHNSNEAQYYVSFFRWQNKPFPATLPEYYALVIEGEKVLTVLKQY